MKLRIVTCRIECHLFAVFLCVAAGMLSATYGQGIKPADRLMIAVSRVSLDSLMPPRYARSFQTADGVVHLEGHAQVSALPEGTLKAAYEPVNPFPEDAVKAGAMNSFLSKSNNFVALGYRIEQDSSGNFSTSVWKSTDGLTTVIRSRATVKLPEAGKVYYGKNGEWAGLFCHRGIIQLHDGTLLAAVYGNFEPDTVTPANKQSRLETRYMLRAFVMGSDDGGNTWNYFASLAVPKEGQKDDSEGFNEWTMVELTDGRILAVIRTGHFTPPVLCYSRDKGHTWSKPEEQPELGPALCDPYLLKLTDGRIALSYGQMEQPTGDRTAFFDRFTAGDHPRKCRLAISSTPAADHWHVYDITGFGDRSAYSTLFEMEPGILMYQAGPEVFEIRITASE